MQITIHTSTSSASYRSQLNELMLEAFGFSFERWHKQNVWNDDYTCYSIIEGELMLANACVYRMDMLVNGEKAEWFQIGAVATRRARRGEGLSRAIITFILEQYPGKTLFLLPNQNDMNFYPKFGFRLIHNRQPFIEKSLDNPPGGMRKLSINSLEVVDHLEHRACYSSILDCTNALPIHWFHLLLDYPENIYEIPALKTMLVAEQDGSVLTIMDIAAKSPLTLISSYRSCLERNIGNSILNIIYL
jgi:GNAT superfamily N-acetyltransferase